LRFCAVSLTLSLSQMSDEFLRNSFPSVSSSRVGVLGLETGTQTEFILLLLMLGTYVCTKLKRIAVF
jgi:hypothetical protein